jgi:hypothetical protein
MLLQAGRCDVQQGCRVGALGAPQELGFRPRTPEEQQPASSVFVMSPAIQGFERGLWRVFVRGVPFDQGERPVRIQHLAFRGGMDAQGLVSAATLTRGLVFAEPGAEELEGFQRSSIGRALSLKGAGCRTLLGLLWPGGKRRQWYFHGVFVEVGCRQRGRWGKYG